MKSKKEIYSYWKKNIDIPLYRTIAKRDLEKIKRNGLNPADNPYRKVQGKFLKLFSLVNRLEKRGFVMKFKTGKRESLGSYHANMSKHELDRRMIDFTPVKEHYEYYNNLKGGAMIAGVRRMTNRLLENKNVLGKNELNLVSELNNFAKKNSRDMKLIKIQGSLPNLDSAYFQLTGTTKGKVRRVHSVKYYESPFGSFDHFLKVIEKHGLKRYSYRLKNQKYYLRVRKPISKEEIVFVN